jgi:uncharacterized protein (TIGR03086 family)
MDVEMYERALARTEEIVAGTRREQFGDPTPCGDWNVRDLLNHIIGGCISVAAGATGKRVGFSEGPDHVAQDHVAAYKRASTDALAAFRAPGALDRTFTLRTGDTPGSVALGLAVADAVVHGWDLAKATGQDGTFDDEVTGALYAMTTQMMAPKGPYPRGSSFGDPVEVADDAPLTDRLVAYLGRDPGD